MFDLMLNDLKHAINGLESKFIQPHLPVLPEHSPADYDLDVRAFCVLSHAALEQYVEDVALGLMNRAVDDWEKNRHLSEPLFALFAFFSPKLPIDDDEKKPEVSFFEHIRLGANTAKSAFSIYLRKKNNGVSVKYLRQMLLPVGLPVPTDPKWTGSLRQLASYRGDNAHKHRVTKITDPAIAKEWVSDCIEMSEKIARDASMALYKSNFRDDFNNWVI